MPKDTAPLVGEWESEFNAKFGQMTVAHMGKYWLREFDAIKDFIRSLLDRVRREGRVDAILKADSDAKLRAMSLVVREMREWSWRNDSRKDNDQFALGYLRAQMDVARILDSLSEETPTPSTEIGA